MRNAALSVGCAILLLGGCGGTVQQRLGLERRAPDEFQVVRRAPLDLPENMQTLPPPQPGIARPQEQTTNVEAREVLTGIERRPPEITAGTPISAGEMLLLASLPGSAEPGIRSVVQEESRELADAQRGNYLFILGWQRNRVERQQLASEVINPIDETRRLVEEGLIEPRPGFPTPDDLADDDPDPGEEVAAQ